MLIDFDAHLVSPRGSRRLSRFWAPRTDTVAQMREALAHDIVLLRGPAGVGKTSLLQQFAFELGEDPTVGVQFVNGPATTAQSLARVAEGFRGGPAEHVLIVDSHRDDGPGITSDDLLGLLRDDPSLRIVVATRHVTGLESPLIALEFDSFVLPAASMLMTREEMTSVLRRNGIHFSDDAVETLYERTHGWPALVQLAGAHLRLEDLSMRTQEEAEAIADYAAYAFTSDMERRLPGWAAKDLTMLAIPPYVTPDVAEAVGIDANTGSLVDLMDALREEGFVWPSATRLVLAEPVRDRWLRQVLRDRPEAVEDARLALSAYLVSAGEPLLAARLAQESRNWPGLASILRSAGPQIWLRDADAFAELVSALRLFGGTAPDVAEVLLTLDPEAAQSQDAPSLAVAALAKLPDTKTAAQTDPAALVSRIHLLRASGRFALAAEAVTLLVDGLRRRISPDGVFLAEAWYQVAMTHLATGKLRDASMALGLSLRSAEGPVRLRTRGAAAIISLLEGDVNTAEAFVAGPDGDQWRESPWGEPTRFAAAWLQLEKGEPDAALEALARVPISFTAREFWPMAAALNAIALLQAGVSADALGALRLWSKRTRITPPSHYHSTLVLVARAKVMIALRQARKAIALFEGPFGLSPITAPTIALSLLYAGRAHDAYVMAIKWGMQTDATPRASLECLVVSLIADVRLNGPGSPRQSSRRAEALSSRNALWSPWSVVGPEDRTPLFSMLSEPAQREVARRRSVFESAVSVPHLTRREQVVLNQLTPNATISDIAQVLVVSPNTVKTQLQSLYRKLRVTDRSSAIRAAHAWGLIDADRDF
ncbi:MAG: hypothetical protein FJW64_06660 [Actinobacteria bacterium]|nr:hypothetical protein [Actinomycetota bacterium]